jgi:hypothetical protein
MRRGLLFLSDFAADIRFAGNASKRHALAALRWADRARVLLSIRERPRPK